MPFARIKEPELVRNKRRLKTITFFAFFICIVTYGAQYMAEAQNDDPIIWNSKTWKKKQEWVFEHGRVVSFTNGEEVCTKE